MTLTHLAGQARISISNISKYETGKILPPVAVVERLADGLGVSSDVKAALIDQATAAHTEVHSWRALQIPNFRHRQEQIAAIEAAAERVRLFQPSLVPGLLQTPEYCRALLALDRVRPLENLTDAVGSRMERQAALYDEAKSFEFVITEGALRWRFCPASVHTVQLYHVASLATLPNVQVGIIPLLTEVRARQTNMFAIFDASAVIVETMTAEVTLREEQLIEFYARAFETLSSHAVYGADAQAVLEAVVSDVRRLG